MGPYIGAPEHPAGNKHPVSQAIDIWSLACVFSLAATWVVCGHPGISRFHKLRELAIDGLRRTESDGTSSEQRNAKFSESHKFHDGKEVLQAVTGWHNYLRSASRKSDNITIRVLDLVDESMLLASPDHRISVSDLCLKLDLILESCSRSEESQISQKFMDLLAEVRADEAC